MAKITSKPLFVADLGDNGGLKLFYSIDDADQFISAEVQSPIGQLLHSKLGGTTWALIDNARASIHNARSDPTHETSIPLRVSEAFGTSHPNALPPNGSPRGKFLQDTLKRHGPDVTVAALAYFTDAISNLGMSREISLGVHLAIGFDQGLNPQSVKSYREAFSAIAAQATRQHRQAASDVTETVAEANELRELMSARLRKASVKMALRYRARLKEIRERFAIAERDIRAVEATYTTQMGLQAPVAYWKDKHQRHKVAAVGYRSLLLWFSIIGTIVVSMALWAVATRIHEAASQNAGAGALAYGAIGLLLTTVTLWAGRILVRLYMSEHHLALDSEERATMIETYLALQLKQQVEPKDLQLVLSGMFRPTADGIVKDDGAPEFGLAALLSKVASK